jgi:Protein of unknown function (DUF1592)/Protein of unknown function (DUF1588)/Protein of unknown function (DUF1595)/Protein of unknown function (DUF1585)
MSVTCQLRTRFSASRAARRFCALWVGVLVSSAAPSMTAGRPDSSGGPPVVARLQPEQYRQIILDLFGPTVKVNGKFEPDIRVGGLLAVGAGRVSVSEAGIDGYDALARSIASQVVSEANRELLIPCTPQSATAADDACARRFIEKVGRRLYRRPLTDEERNFGVAAARTGADAVHNFYTGLSFALAFMLESPQFLFRRETAEPDPALPGRYRMDGYSKASLLSFFLWDTAPDEELLKAAETGELSTPRGLSRQVDRMLASARLESGVRAFFSDMLEFDRFVTLSKESTIYPKFSSQVSVQAAEQTLRTITDHLLARNGDYRDLFTTRRTFLTPLLGSIYGVPMVKTTPYGAAVDWIPYEYPEGDPRAGLLAQISFVALHSHPGRTSPTLRGKALREVILGQMVPAPPANVDFKVVQDTGNPQFRTARERLTAHRTDPACAGCHKIMDPIGLSLENFDSSGGFRQAENGVPIDATGELDGIVFHDPAGLGRAVRDNPAATANLVNRLYSYAWGRTPERGEIAWVRYVWTDFVASGGKLPQLMRKIAMSEETYRLVPPRSLPEVASPFLTSNQFRSPDSNDGDPK